MSSVQFATSVEERRLLSAALPAIRMMQGLRRVACTELIDAVDVYWGSEA